VATQNLLELIEGMFADDDQRKEAKIWIYSILKTEEQWETHDSNWKEKANKRIFSVRDTIDLAQFYRANRSIKNIEEENKEKEIDINAYKTIINSIKTHTLICKTQINQDIIIKIINDVNEDYEKFTKEKNGEVKNIISLASKLLWFFLDDQICIFDSRAQKTISAYKGIIIPKNSKSQYCNEKIKAYENFLGKINKAFSDEMKSKILCVSNIMNIKNIPISRIIDRYLYEHPSIINKNSNKSKENTSEMKNTSEIYVKKIDWLLRKIEIEINDDFKEKIKFIVDHIDSIKKKPTQAPSKKSKKLLLNKIGNQQSSKHPHGSGRADFPAE
jgi:hypothetical protein